MAVGISAPLPAYTMDPAFMAGKAEELGFDSIWFAEHPILPVHSDTPFPKTGGAYPGRLSPLHRPIHSAGKGFSGHHQYQAGYRNHSGPRA